MPQFDLLVRNGTLLTMDAKDSILGHAAVGITGDTITYIGGDDPSVMTATDTIDARGGIIMPGLINAHTHAAMTLFRGLADDLPLMEWLTHYIFPAESKMDADFVHVGSLLACASSQRSTEPAARGEKPQLRAAQRQTSRPGATPAGDCSQLSFPQPLFVDVGRGPEKVVTAAIKDRSIDPIMQSLK